MEYVINNFCVPISYPMLKIYAAALSNRPTEAEENVQIASEDMWLDRAASSLPHALRRIK